MNPSPFLKLSQLPEDLRKHFQACHLGTAFDVFEDEHLGFVLLKADGTPIPFPGIYEAMAHANRVLSATPPTIAAAKPRQVQTH